MNNFIIPPERWERYSTSSVYKRPFPHYNRLFIHLYEDRPTGLFHVTDRIRYHENDEGEKYSTAALYFNRALLFQLPYSIPIERWHLRRVYISAPMADGATINGIIKCPNYVWQQIKEVILLNNMTPDSVRSVVWKYWKPPRRPNSLRSRVTVFPVGNIDVNSGIYDNISEVWPDGTPEVVDKLRLRIIERADTHIPKEFVTKFFMKEFNIDAKKATELYELRDEVGIL